MFIIYDMITDRPYAHDKAGHFKVYTNKKAASAYISRNYLRNRCVVRQVDHIAFVEGGFI